MSNTGIMDWTAKWIWAESHSTTPNFYMYARKEFETPAVGGAKLSVTCSTEYRVYVNGRYLGRGPSPCYPAFQYYDEYDIGHLVRPGKNVIAALCYNYGVDTHCRPQAQGAFLLQAELGDGDRQIIATDESWKVKAADEWDRDSARMFWTTGFQEVYDSRRKPVGWNVVGFDDSAWDEPLVVGGVGTEPWTELIPRQIPHLKEREVFPESVQRRGFVTQSEDAGADIATGMYSEKAVTDRGAIRYAAELLNTSGDAAVVEAGQERFIVLDFGREVVGFPTIRVRDGGQATIDLGYSEALDEKGDVVPIRQGILQADRLILHGGRQEWQTFGRRAFRYMQLTFRDVDVPLLIESVSVNGIGLPVEQVSSFECSDDLLNRIWNTGVYTLSVCMQDAFEDCPLREHGQYPGDVRVQALTNYYCFFDTSLVQKALWQFVQCQREDGFFNALWPSGTNHALPDYNLVWILALHDYYLYTGDESLVERLYPNVRMLLENWIRTQEGENGLLVYEPNDGGMLQEWWLFIDHAPLDKHGEVAAYNAFYYAALRAAAKLAASVGRHEDSAIWHARSENVFRAFNERFWWDEEGVYADCSVDGRLSGTISEQTNTLAVLFGLADAQRSRRIASFLVSDGPRVRSSGPYFNFYVLQAMARLGMTQEALDLIRADWGEMLKRGATTWWETFSREWPADALCPDSLCHGWSAAPTYFLPAEVLGVKPAMPDSDVVVIQPRPGDLQWARGCLKMGAAVVDVEWERSADGFRLDIDAPSGFMAALPVSDFRNPVIEEIDLGPETPERRARKTYGWGNVIWRDGEERDPYLDWLESQECEPPEHYKTRKRLFAQEEYVWVRECSVTHVRYEIHEAPQ